jgi:hypothetical protein
MATLTKETLIQEVQEHLNEVVLDGLKVVRLIGCGESEDDFFYIFDEGYGSRFYETGSGICYMTAVGAPYYLKDHLPKEDYDQLDRLRSLTGADKVEEMVWREYV